MNLFRSEEHARNWSGFDAGMERMLQPVAFWADVFSNDMFRFRSRPDFISWLHSDAGRAAVKALRASMP
jgi:hypothetical protein